MAQLVPLVGAVDPGVLLIGRQVHLVAGWRVYDVRLPGCLRSIRTCGESGWKDEVGQAVAVHVSRSHRFP